MDIQDKYRELALKMKALKTIRDYGKSKNLSNNELSRVIGSTPEQASNIVLLKVHELGLEELLLFLKRTQKEKGMSFDEDNDDFDSEEDIWKK